MEGIMPVVGTLFWGFGKNDRSPFGHPLLQDLGKYVRECNQIGIPPRWQREIFENRDNDLPERPHGYYWEFRLDNGTYRMVLGNGGEVFVTWDHYRNFLQVFRVPDAFPPRRPALR